MNNSTGIQDFIIRVIVVMCLLAPGMGVSGQDQETSENDESSTHELPDTSGWRCQLCPFPYELIGDVEVGLGYISDNFTDFGNFGGREEDGIYGVLGADLIYRREDGRYLDVYAQRLGLDSRSLLIEGGRQGSYRLWLGFNGIPYFHADNARTIFHGAGTANQTLPADWVRGGTTDEMSRLDNNLQDVTVNHRRETLALGFAVKKDTPWRYAADFKRATKEGSSIKGASFIFRAAELAAPVDYETTQIDATVGYVRDDWELELAYHLSNFDNGNRSLRWQNPFSGINGAAVGELAEPPDNQFHSFMLSGSWRQSRYLILAGQVAIGRATQNEQFLAPTLNPNLVNPALPRSDLNGEVDNRIANLRITSNFTNRLSSKLQLRFDERDNKTPRDSFVQVVSDTFVVDPRTNLPFSFKRRSVNASIDYRVASSVRLTASAERREMQRTFQEVEDTDTSIYSLQLRATPTSRMNLNIKASREERSNDLDPALLGPLENPGLRRFHFAEKLRDSLRLSADYALTDNFFAGAFYEVSDEEFSDTRIGLSDARDEIYGVDLSMNFAGHVSAYAFVALESLDADISGVDNIGGAPWQASQKDDFRTVGLGVNFSEMPGQWIKAAVDFTYARAEGEIYVDKRGPAQPFPDLETRRLTLDASVERMLRENLNLRLGYLYGRLIEDDFFRNDVAPDTVPTLLTLGIQPSNRTVHVISAMLRYRFH